MVETLSNSSKGTWLKNATTMNESFELRGILRGHGGWVTQVSTNSKYPEMVISSSRDKTLLIWKITHEDGVYAVPQKRLTGHEHFVSDVVLSSDGHFAISGSWDKTLRLWDLNRSVSTRRFVDHCKDVLSVAFSADNRQIVSGSRDKTLKLWNTIAQCKYTMQEDGHTNWVSSVKICPNVQNPVVVSGSWDTKVKVWSLNTCKLRTEHTGHTGYLNVVTISPDGSLCASGGKDWTVMLWDLNEQRHLYTLEHRGIVNALCFAPNRYWLCVAIGPAIKIWDLESKILVDECRPEVIAPGVSLGSSPDCLCLCWSGDGQTLFAGYSDNNIRVWQIVTTLLS